LRLGARGRFDGDNGTPDHAAWLHQLESILTTLIEDKPPDSTANWRRRSNFAK
jgi:hypothetical protein